MYKLFKKFRGNEVTENTKTANEIIEEIHESFFTEVDKLLEEAKVAKSLDTDKQYLIDKRDRLIALGFHRTKEVLEAEREISRLDGIRRENEQKKNLLEAINYFSFKYPNYKFITEESVKRICRKYGLVYGEVGRYKGTVPEKNLREIEKFSIKPEDELYVYEEFFFRKRNQLRYVDRIGFEHYHAKIEKGEINIPRGMVDERRERCSKAPLEIAAPVEDFNMEGARVEGHQILNIPDPVVLKPVFFKDQKYYLIVTAWGTEASDPEVLNERLN